MTVLHVPVYLSDLEVRLKINGQLSTVLVWTAGKYKSTRVVRSRRERYMMVFC